MQFGCTPYALTLYSKSKSKNKYHHEKSYFHGSLGIILLGSCNSKSGDSHEGHNHETEEHNHDGHDHEGHDHEHEGHNHEHEEQENHAGGSDEIIPANQQRRKLPV